MTIKSDDFYKRLDAGIRYPVRALHARVGIETCQSCEGGEGHAYDRPTIDLVARDDDALGFAALAALTDEKIDVREVALVWPCTHGLPYERIWRLTLARAYPERADEIPGFVHESRLTSADETIPSPAVIAL